MKNTLLLACLLLAYTGLFAQQYNLTLSHDGVNRKYHIYVPPSYSAGTPAPLILNHHGATSNGPQQLLYSNMLPVADTAGFIICFPDGLNNVWNSGFPGFPYNADPDDVGFISSLIQYLGTQYDIDPARVYSCGMSNGGFQSFRLACDLENKIAAIASVTGSMADSVAFYCQTNRPVPVLQIHGTDDPTVPYSGTPFVYYGQDSLIAWWVDKNNCGALTETDTFPNTSLSDSSRAVYFRYNNCQDGTEVWFYKILNGGHTWPGALLNIGVTNQDIIASEEIWNFFRRHSHPNPATGIQELPEDLVSVSFPNPVSSELPIHFDGAESLDYTLYEMGGKAIFKGKLENSGTFVPVESLSPGLYLLKLESSRFSSTYQLLKR